VGLGVELPEVVHGVRASARRLSAAAAFAEWFKRYGRPESAGSEAEVFRIGEEMFRWLDQDGALREWLEMAEWALEEAAGFRQVGLPRRCWRRP
jgi:hypothetical protein